MTKKNTLDYLQRNVYHVINMFEFTLTSFQPHFPHPALYQVDK